MTDPYAEQVVEKPPSLMRRIFRRKPWEIATMILIALGVVMLTQPFSLLLYSWSLTPLLIGTFGFVIVSHFPD
ncbi:MAG: hypothetical protein AAFX92_10180 [Pseudomonadota bacterium]